MSMTDRGLKWVAIAIVRAAWLIAHAMNPINTPRSYVDIDYSDSALTKFE